MLVEWTRTGKIADAQSLRQEATPGARVPVPHGFECSADLISEVTPRVEFQHLVRESGRQELETYAGDVDQRAGSDEIVQIAGAKRDIDVEVHGDRFGDPVGVGRRSARLHQGVRGHCSRDGEAWLLQRWGGVVGQSQVVKETGDEQQFEIWCQPVDGGETSCEVPRPVTVSAKPGRRGLAPELDGLERQPAVGWGQGTQVWHGHATGRGPIHLGGE